MQVTRTTIIINDLSREQCLTVPKLIRKDVDAVLSTQNLTSSVIEHWSELPFLSRLVIIFDTEAHAELVYTHLKAKHTDLHIHLNESIVRRHKSFDATLTTPVSPKPEKYEEKEPIKSDDESDGPYFSPKKDKKVLVQGSLRLDTKVMTQHGTVSPMSPTITLEDVDQ